MRERGRAVCASFAASYRFGYRVGVSSFWSIFAASLGGGLLIGAKYQYQDWKAKRLTLPEPERNAGFWTDRRVKQADIAAWAFIVFLLIPPLYMFAALMAASWLDVQFPLP